MADRLIFLLNLLLYSNPKLFVKNQKVDKNSEILATVAFLPNFLFTTYLGLP